MRLFRVSLLFGITIFIIFTVWSFIKDNAFNLTENISRGVIFGVVFAVITSLTTKNKKK